MQQWRVFGVGWEGWFYVCEPDKVRVVNNLLVLCHVTAVSGWLRDCSNLFTFAQATVPVCGCPLLLLLLWGAGCGVWWEQLLDKCLFVG